MSNTFYDAQYTGSKVITWKNFTDTSTPLSAANLQKSHQAISDMDQELIAAFQSVDQIKADKQDLQTVIKNVLYEPTTGTFTFKFFDTTKADLVINTALEKIIVNWHYNTSTQKLELIQDDGTTVEVDLSALIAQVDFEDSDEISWNINAQGKVSAHIKNGSITDEKLESGFLNACTQQANAAATSATNAEYYNKLSESFAHGQTNLVDRPGEATDNAMYYAQQAQSANTAAQSAKTDAVDASTSASASAMSAGNSASAASLSAQTASNKAQDAESYAYGTKDGNPVPSTDPTYHNNAKYYAEQASDSATQASQSAQNAGDYKEDAEAWAVGKRGGTDVPSTDDAYNNNSKYYAEQSKNSALTSADAEAWAVGQHGGTDVPSTDPQYNNNAKYYYEQTQQIAQSFSGALRPKGTCAFAQLPAIASSVPGDMWNISDRFTTTSDFREGAGKSIAPGANVYLTVDGKWDILAGTNPIMQGATSQNAGVQGDVPAPQAGDQAKFLRGDGTWENVPDPQTMTGATASQAGTGGLTPVPQAGDEGKVLQGNGRWGKKLQIDVVVQNNVYGYIGANNTFIPFKSQADIDAAVSAAMVGDATAADVLAGKTFTNSSNSGMPGSMPDNSTRTSNGEVPGIQSNYPNEPVRNGISSQFNTGTDNVRRFAMAPPKGYYPGSASYIGIEAQTKTCTPSTSQQTISRDSGKVLESVTVNAIQTQEKTVTAGTSAASVTPDSGKWLSKVTYNPTPSQEKTITASRSAQTVTPDSGKLLSKVTVNKYPDASGNYTCGSNNGAASSNDMGTDNNYRYVNATNVYNKGVADGRIKSQSGYFQNFNTVNGPGISYSFGIVCPSDVKSVNIKCTKASGSWDSDIKCCIIGDWSSTSYQIITNCTDLVNNPNYSISGKNIIYILFEDRSKNRSNNYKISYTITYNY